jgi:hypothetical protein
MSRKHTLAAGAMLAAAALVAAPAGAQLTEFTITDGSASATVTNITGARTGSAGGLGEMRTGVGATSVNHAFQNWFWYRTTGDTREYALSNLAVGTANTNRARLVYLEPSNDGATPGALSVQLEFTINDLTASTTSPEELSLTIAFTFQNLTSGNLNVQFYSYLDLDLAGSSSGDSARVSGRDDQIITVTTPGSSAYQAATAQYIASATNHIRYQIGAFPTVRDLLTNATAEFLANTDPTFGPGDFTGGHQWGTTLAPAGGPQDSLTGSVTILIRTNNCEADANGDGAVNSNDISAFLAKWLDAIGGGCP